MSKNGKQFEKFLREQREPSAKDQAYKAGQALLDAIVRKAPQEEIDALSVQARTANQFLSAEENEKQAEINDRKRISPAYWVTQKDFQDAFGRRYDAMSKEDQRDFFQLARVGATKRTDVPGADAGAFVPTTRRPDFIPTFQDVDGVKVPESAFSRLERVTPETADGSETVKIGQYEVKPVYPEAEQRETRGAGFRSVEDYRKRSKEIEKIKIASAIMQAEVDAEKEKTKYRDALYPWAKNSPFFMGPKPQPSAELPGMFDMQPEPPPAPDPPPAPEPSPAPESVLDQKKSTRTQKPLISAGAGTFPAIPAGLSALIASTSPIPSPVKTSPKKPEQINFDNKQPSGLAQATGIATDVKQFAKNLDLAAGKKVQEVGQKISDIAKNYLLNTPAPAPDPAPAPEPPPAPDPEPTRQAVAGVDVEGPPTSERERSRMMLDAMYADQQKAKKQGPRGTSLKAVDPSKGYWVFDQTTEKWVFVDSKKDKSDSPQRQTVATPAPTQPSAKSSSVPAQVAAAMSPQPKPLPNFGQISPEIASRMVSAPTPQQVSTQLTGRPLTTQERDRFKFDSAVPASVAASMNTVSPVRTPLSQEPLTNQPTQAAIPVRQASSMDLVLPNGRVIPSQSKNFIKTAGSRDMNDIYDEIDSKSSTEINSEFEKIFGKEEKNLPIPVKRDMLMRYYITKFQEEGTIDAMYGGERPLPYTLTTEPDAKGFYLEDNPAMEEWLKKNPSNTYKEWQELLKQNPELAKQLQQSRKSKK